ncbi:MAG: TylF/MycF/NovP-related O-methyltransferase [Candidatus Paceibacterota bacterium]
MKFLNQFNTEDSFNYENGFYLTGGIDRLGKLLAHYELYKMIKDLPGAVVECGVFKGASLIRLATFRNLLETPHSRKIIGFDTYGKFPATKFEKDKKYLKKFVEGAGENSVDEKELASIFEFKGIKNFELVKGDINKTVPEYIKNNPHLKISFLHIDTDVYEPAVTILKNMYEHVVRGGIIAFDDYGTFPGETKAVDEFFKDKKVEIKKLSLSHIPSYIIKP